MIHSEGFKYPEIGEKLVVRCFDQQDAPMFYPAVVSGAKLTIRGRYIVKTSKNCKFFNLKEIVKYKPSIPIEEHKVALQVVKKMDGTKIWKPCTVKQIKGEEVIVQTGEGSTLTKQLNELRPKQQREHFNLNEVVLVPQPGGQVYNAGVVVAVDDKEYAVDWRLSGTHSGVYMLENVGRISSKMERYKANEEVLVRYLDKEDRPLYLPGKVLNVGPEQYSVQCDGETLELATHDELFKLTDFLAEGMKVDVANILKPVEEFKPANPAPAILSSESETELSESEFWSCNVCTMRNRMHDDNRMSILHCQACGTKRPRKIGMKRDQMVSVSTQNAYLQSQPKTKQKKRSSEGSEPSPKRKKLSDTSDPAAIVETTSSVPVPPEEPKKRTSGEFPSPREVRTLYVNVLSRKFFNMDITSTEAFEQQIEKLLSLTTDSEKKDHPGNMVPKEKFEKEKEKNERLQKTINQLVSKVKEQHQSVKDAQAKMREIDSERMELKRNGDRYMQEIGVCNGKLTRAGKLQREQNESILRYQEILKDWRSKYEKKEKQVKYVEKERDVYFNQLRKSGLLVKKNLT